MAYITVNLPNLVLTTANTPSTSNAVFLDDQYALGLIAPASLTGTITVQVEPSSSGTNFANLQSGGTDVTIAAGKAIVLHPFPYKQIALVSGVQEAAPRTFILNKIFFI